MVGIITKLASLSGLLLLADTVAAQKVVSIPFQRRERLSNRLDKRASAFTASLNNYLVLGEYFATVEVGTPAQTLELVIDTGSSDVWFFAPGACTEQSAGGECEGGTYNSKDSSTYKLIKANNFSIQYETEGSGVVGDYITDTFSIGGISVTNLEMAVATAANDTNTGIMGIGLDTGESQVEYTGKSYSNLPDELVSQGKIASKSYSLYLDNLASSQGTVIFGGYDTAKFSGNIVMLPLQVDADTGVKDSFAVAWTSVGYTTTSGTFTVTGTSDFPVAAVLDSGTTLSYIPQDIFEYLAEEVGTNEVAYDQEVGAYLVQCSIRNQKSTLDFGFGGTGGPVISVPYSELAIPSYGFNGDIETLSDGTPACIFGLQPTSSGDPIILGQTFLRSAYVMYDLDNLAAGLAPTVFDATGSNLVEYQSSGTQASITTDATGPTVTVASAADDPFGNPFATSSVVYTSSGSDFGGQSLSASSQAVKYTRSLPSNDVPASTLASTLTPIGAAASVASGTATTGSTTSSGTAASTATKTGAAAPGASVPAVSNVALVAVGTMVVSLLGGCLLL